MKEMVPGHEFLLESLDGGSDVPLRFVKRVGHKFPGNKFPAHPGTTTQDVLRALIARAVYVDGQDPHSANAVVIASCRSAILALEQRHAQRHGRRLATVRADIENEATCSECGHVQCAEHA